MILQEIAAKTRQRVENKKLKKSLAVLVREVETSALPQAANFYEALAGPEISFICEVKKASPSKGVIAAYFPYLSIAQEYEEAGAAAISVLTEPFYFLGSDEYLREIAGKVQIPVLRKDFTVDLYQIYEAKLLGAAAVLLICALLTEAQLREYRTAAESLGMSALVEVHSKEEAEAALRSGARIVGVNNRDLRTFEVDIGTSGRLRSLIPEDILFVSESGIRTPEDIHKLQSDRVNGVLIGEALMSCPNKKEQLAALRGE